MREMIVGFGGARLCGLSIAVWSLSANYCLACDDLATKLMTKVIKPAIESVDCNALARAGLDKPDHHLRTVCYSSSGPQSSIEIVADFTCKTSDKAFIRASVSDTLTARATVSGSNCQIENLDIKAAGELANGLLHAFDANGKARRSLQDALDKAC